MLFESEYIIFLKYLTALIDDIGNLISEKHKMSNEVFIQKLCMIILNPKYRVQLGILLIIISFIIYIISVV
mgnify:CR=1 FL=1